MRFYIFFCFFLFFFVLIQNMNKDQKNINSSSFYVEPSFVITLTDSHESFYNSAYQYLQSSVIFSLTFMLMQMPYTRLRWIWSRHRKLRFPPQSVWLPSSCQAEKDSHERRREEGTGGSITVSTASRICLSTCFISNS